MSKTLLCYFEDGCPLKPELGGNKQVPMRIFRKGNELWAKPDVEVGHQKTIIKAKTLKPKDIHHACAEWVINYWEKELGLTVFRCQPPKPHEKAKYTKAVRARTILLRKQLIEAGVQLD